MASGLSNYRVDSHEQFTNVEDILPRPDTIKGHIEKFMTYIKAGNWTKKYPINTNILANDVECTVKLPKIVVEQGYYTIPRYKNERPDFWNKCSSNGRIEKGTTFIAEVLHEDTKNIHFIGKE